MAAELLAQCRSALQASDETAKAATPGPWRCAPGYFGETWSLYREFPDDGGTLGVAAQVQTADARYLGSADPTSRLALNAALRTVLDGIEATLAEHAAEPHPEGPWCPLCSYGYPCPDARRALASLAAIATALGMQDAHCG